MFLLKLFIFIQFCIADSILHDNNNYFNEQRKNILHLMIFTLKKIKKSFYNDYHDFSNVFFDF